MNYKHGFTRLEERTKENPKWRTHISWISMRDRCDNPKNKQYADYGGRGISYDPAWAEFAVFAADMGEAPVGLTLDRIDNGVGYSKSNCRWATRKEQNRNRRMNRVLEFNGEKLIISEWAEKLGVKPRLLRVRLNRGWSVEKTLVTPVA